MALIISQVSYYLTYYFCIISYPIIYPIITFTYRKVKIFPINNSRINSLTKVLASLLTHNRATHPSLDLGLAEFGKCERSASAGAAGC